MEYSVNFGRLSAPAAHRPTDSPFRIAVLGDFSGRANSGRLSTSQELAKRAYLRVDFENLDEVIRRLDVQLQLPIGDQGGSTRVPITELEDFHPDQLFENLPVFSKLSGLRSKLMDNSTYPAARSAVQSLLGVDLSDASTRSASPPPPSRGTHLPNLKTSDFATLVGKPASEHSETSINQLIKELIRPHVIAGGDAAQEQMIGFVDEALSDTMRRVLHDPDLQALESAWRCVQLLTRRLETSVDLQIVLYDISAEEIAADLGRADNLQETGLYQLLVEQPTLDQQQGPLSVLIGNYAFEKSPPHADLLGRMAKIAAAAQAPFLASISKRCLKIEKPEEVHPMVQQAWDRLCELPEAAYLSLSVPSFMLRWPYGRKTEPIDSFAFEEFTRRSGIGGMLWGNSAFLAGALIGLTYQKQGIKSMELGSILTMDDVPFYFYTDQHGDQVALPCTDRLLSERLAAHVHSQNLTPVLSIKGRNEVRLGGIRSLRGADLAGPWAPVTPSASEQASSSENASSNEDASTPAAAVSSGEANVLPAAELKPEIEADPESPAAIDSGEGDDAPEASSGAESINDELDALLAGLDEPSSGAATEGDSNDDSADAIDPELEALLGDL